MPVTGCPCCMRKDPARGLIARATECGTHVVDLRFTADQLIEREAQRLLDGAGLPDQPARVIVLVDSDLPRTDAVDSALAALRESRAGLTVSRMPRWRRDPDYTTTAQQRIDVALDAVFDLFERLYMSIRRPNPVRQ